MKTGLHYVKSLPEGRFDETSLGVNLLYFHFHETGKHVVGNHYYGTVDLLPYNLRFYGVGLEIPWRIQHYYTDFLRVGFEVALSFTFIPNFAEKTKANQTTGQRYTILSAGLVPIGQTLQFNSNFNFMIAYVF